MKCMKAIFCFALLVMMRNSSEAGIIASFTSDGSAFLPSAINVGDTTDVPLYLWYDGNGTNFLNSPGLLSAGIGITFAPTGIADATFQSLGAGWDPGLSAATIDNITGSAILQTTVGFFDPAVTDGGTNAILLGTFRFTGVAAGSSLFTLTDADLGFDDTVVDDADVVNGIPATILDGVIEFERTASIAVNASPAAVPEPATGVVFLLGTGFLAWRRSRKCIRHAPRDEV